ncbi:hypothetical protein GUITHDRAFT_109927 [Guillardia theta CCMP2712]|uniref:Uncharacterized protein n=1 Tax=Guillardia theta (strain CCMP2712) TaxID=905079 RepID=L1J7R4_GUITC|nr:hypothetical protein GUITHDRAFT_109927 [Guillardia theta CCMP2712]EKX44144.1 hypothetical protein GUITHDRAFT_109927 [Guillardia theta CCMP2712]|eukprot:XP_005831124.1 hypothetical protein GUITHDRAFT_109927 [Guillardia theta CCMP2712]
MSPWDMPVSDLNVGAQSQLTTAVFASLCFTFVCLNAVGVWMTYRSNQSHRENKRFEAKMKALAAEKAEHDVSPLPAASERGQSGNCRVSPTLDKS